MFNLKPNILKLHFREQRGVASAPWGSLSTPPPIPQLTSVKPGATASERPQQTQLKPIQISAPVSVYQVVWR